MKFFHNKPKSRSTTVSAGSIFSTCCDGGEGRPSCNGLQYCPYLTMLRRERLRMRTPLQVLLYRRRLYRTRKTAILSWTSNGADTLLIPRNTAEERETSYPPPKGAQKVCVRKNCIGVSYEVPRIIRFVWQRQGRLATPSYQKHLQTAHGVVPSFLIVRYHLTSEILDAV